MSFQEGRKEGLPLTTTPTDCQENLTVLSQLARQGKQEENLLWELRASSLSFAQTECSSSCKIMLVVISLDSPQIV